MEDFLGNEAVDLLAKQAPTDRTFYRADEAAGCSARTTVVQGEESGGFVGGSSVMDVTKPCKFTWFGAMDVTKPYKFIGFGVAGQHGHWQGSWAARSQVGGWA